MLTFVMLTGLSPGAVRSPQALGQLEHNPKRPKFLIADALRGSADSH